MKGVDLNIPLAYADRFRIRKPGIQWDFHPPHIDGAYLILQNYSFLSFHSLLKYLVGGTLERWEDPYFRKCFEDILNGNWRDHDPFALEGRLNARTSLRGMPNQSSIFRTFQGWLAMRWGDFLFWNHFNICTRIFLFYFLLIHGFFKFQWDRSNPRHSSCFPWRSAYERIYYSEAVLQPNCAF